MTTDLNKLIQIDEDLFEYCGVRVESISYVFNEDEIKIYAEICSVGGHNINSDLIVIVAFYTDKGIEHTIDCYIRKDSFFKCKILRESNYFDDSKYLNSLKSRISKVCAFIEKN